MEKPQNRTRFLVFFVGMLLLSSCVKDDKSALFDSYNSTSIVFEPSYDQIFTNDLKHYKAALEFWRKPHYKKNIRHFPTHLDKENAYHFFYLPRIMQGNSMLELKISFPSKDQAVTYFNKFSQNYAYEFENITDYKASDFCALDRFIFDKDYPVENIHKIRILFPVLCSGKKLSGGISSSIFLDEQNKSVICIARDLYP